MNVFISGTHSGIGRAIAELFLNRGAHVVGFDIQESTIDHAEYEHHIADVSDKNSFPELTIEANQLGSIYFNADNLRFPTRFRRGQAFQERQKGKRSAKRDLNYQKNKNRRPKRRQETEIS